MFGAHAHGQSVEVVELTMVGQFIMAQSLAHDRQCLEVAPIIHLDVGVLAPEVSFEDTTTPYPNLHAPATEVVQHANLFNKPHWMVQGQDIDTRPES